MRKATTFTAAALLLVFFAGCTGAEGPVGPEGPEGPAGPQGPAGSVEVSTQTITLRPTDFTASGSVEIANYELDIITSEIASDGLVMAYTDYLTADVGWVGLPLTLPATTFVTVEMNYAFQPGAFSVLFIHTEEAGEVADIFAGSRVRVIAVPPGQASAAQNLKGASYEEAVQALGLKE